MKSDFESNITKIYKKPLPTRLSQLRLGLIYINKYVNDHLL